MPASISEAIEDIKAGKFVITVDDESRENEGDLAIAAEKAAELCEEFEYEDRRRIQEERDARPIGVKFWDWVFGR